MQGPNRIDRDTNGPVAAVGYRGDLAPCAMGFIFPKNAQYNISIVY